MRPFRMIGGPSSSVEETAARWVIEERAGLSVRRSATLDAWLEACLDHQVAFEQARLADEAMGRHGAEPEMMALREAALGARPVRLGLPPVLMAAALGCLALLGAIGLWAIQRPTLAPGPAPVQPAEIYQTAIGERSTISLPDGSVATLNTASRMEVAYTSGEGRIRLLDGQAVFTVAHGRSTPFRVYARDRVITATGTQFEVLISQGAVRVALIEGAVRVTAATAATAGEQGETLAPGEVLVGEPDGRVRIRSENVARLTDWRSGLVSFEETPLDQAVAEINRYSRTPVVLGDAQAARRRLSGTFRTGEPERFARTAGEVLSLDVSSEDGTIVLTSPGA